MPPQWLIYVTVANLDENIRNCVDLGGKIISDPRNLGKGRFCIIQDAAGAAAALYQKPVNESQ